MGALRKPQRLLVFRSRSFLVRCRRLEGELGVALFVRGNRGRQLSLTRDGQRFRRRAQEIVMMAERAERELLSSAMMLRAMCISVLRNAKR